MSYPIIKKPRGRFFPHGGDRRTWNDIEDPLNNRRMRTDPLKDGYDPPDEDPIVEDGPAINTPDIPI